MIRTNTQDFESEIKSLININYIINYYNCSYLKHIIKFIIFLSFFFTFLIPNKPKINFTNEKVDKKNITVRYLDFWPNFSIEHFDIHYILLERYNVKILDKSNSIITDNPDFIIYSCFGSEHTNYNSIKLYLSLENDLPDFNVTDYAIGLRIIKNEIRYFKKPIDVNYFAKMKNIYNILVYNRVDISKKKFCAFLVSNGFSEQRNNFYELLSNYKQVDSGGDYLNNIGYKVKNKTEFFLNYKFAIVFENSKNLGYATEKIYDAFYAGVIPIYWGDDSLMETTFNPRSYIHIKDEKDFNKTIKFIKKIDKDFALYNRIIHQKILLDDKKYDKDMKKFKKFIWNAAEQVFNKTKINEKIMKKKEA